MNQLQNNVYQCTSTASEKIYYLHVKKYYLPAGKIWTRYYFSRCIDAQNSVKDIPEGFKVLFVIAEQFPILIAGEFPILIAGEFPILTKNKEMDTIKVRRYIFPLFIAFCCVPLILCAYFLVTRFKSHTEVSYRKARK